MSATVHEHRPNFRAKASRICDDCGGKMLLEICNHKGDPWGAPSYEWNCLDCGLVRPEWWDQFIEISARLQAMRPSAQR